MTVKLAKLFGSSTSNGNNNGSSSNNNNNNGSQLPPPLPPPNANMKQKYYDHQPAAIYGNAYDDDDDDDDVLNDYDDNMSLYSSNMANPACMQRGHLYNNSQRPLLGERKPNAVVPQLLPKKKLPPIPTPPLHMQPLNVTASAAIATSAAAAAAASAAATTTSREERSYISPYVQQQKRDSAKGLHGFNDFDALSQQYNQHLQSPHIGYPYGSPPSPTAQSSDFVFEPLQQQHAHAHAHANAHARHHYYEQQQHQNQNQHQLHHGKAVSTSSTGTSKSNCSSTSTSPAAVANVPPATSSIAPLYGNVGSYQQDVYLPSHYLGHPSRFEDDFCTRRNMDFQQQHQQQQQQQLPSTGPFIFGISHEQQQTDYGLQQQQQLQLQQQQHQQQHNNLKQLPHTVINATSPVKDHNGSLQQQSLSDTSADSGKGAKFLLRKRKSKKTTAAATTVAVAAAATTTTTTTSGTGSSEHKAKKKAQQHQQQKQQQQHRQPTIKCVLVGDGAVGKTNLILSYLENRFNSEHVPTASDIYNADVMVNDSPVHLTLCDTAGQDTLDPLRELCYPDSDVFLLCFSVVKPETFDAIKAKWAPKFAKSKAALVLVGTQADLRSNLNVLNKLQTNGEKPISYADAWDLATTIGAKYIETSSVTQDKVKEVFDTAIWEGLVPTTLPPTPSFWKKLFCLA
ncbi:AF4/FMR2 family member 4 [Scaptodrosophila lebanonensis]|uniref:AF4/FMR2 family member 4 n=1 Tax=Drosophila lebanonensis TaxID=7225 RepID=A0A6J2TQR8_DROLE|nr:AF4/FMR2 family member 4 [Scaptodrosophila lebanonensis]